MTYLRDQAELSRHELIVEERVRLLELTGDRPAGAGVNVDDADR